MCVLPRKQTLSDKRCWFKSTSLFLTCILKATALFRYRRQQWQLFRGSWARRHGRISTWAGRTPSPATSSFALSRTLWSWLPASSVPWYVWVELFLPHFSRGSPWTFGHFCRSLKSWTIHQQLWSILVLCKILHHYKSLTPSKSMPQKRNQDFTEGYPTRKSSFFFWGIGFEGVKDL